MNVYLRGEIWWGQLWRGGKRVRLSLRTRDRLEAEKRAAALQPALAEHLGGNGAEITNNWISKRLHAIRYRSKLRGGECLTREEIGALVARAGGRCELTGIPFSDARPRGCRRAPFAPSIDRIDSRDGYTAANCRLVCFAANVALNQWGEGTLRQLAIGLLGHDLGHTPA